MHLQAPPPIPDWPLAFIKMPKKSLLKSVNDPSVLREAYNLWTSIGLSPDDLYLDYRHIDLDYTFSTDWEQMVEKWRVNFFRFIDRTYLENYAPYIKLIEELNEYTDTRMVTDMELLAPRLTSAQAAVWVWNNEFRGKTVTSPDGGVGNIPSDCRLVVCNSPVGNDIPIEFFRLCRDEDAVLGVRTYTHWVNKERDPEDFRWHSGRPFFNEQAYGIKVDYVLGESGPYNGSTTGGWRNDSCMGGDRNLLVSGMRDWIRDLKTTAAYQEDRILGPGAWFTSKIASKEERWKYYLLWEPDLTALAEMCTQEWKPGDEPPPPPPPPPADEERGKPRIQYARVYNIIPENATRDEAISIFTKGWDRSRETTGGSYDDSGIGDLDNRLARLYGIPGDKKQIFRDWYSKYYPSVVVEFSEISEADSEDSTFKLSSPVDGIPLFITNPFNAPRTYANKLHEGIDLRAMDSNWQPVPIIAPAPGVIIWASDRRRSDGAKSDYGKHIILDHENGYITWLAHMSVLTGRPGERVAIGDMLGIAGKTGRADGVHLHLTAQHIGQGLRGYVVSDVIDPAPLLGLD